LEPTLEAKDLLLSNIKRKMNMDRGKSLINLIKRT